MMGESDVKAVRRIVIDVIKELGIVIVNDPKTFDYNKDSVSRPEDLAK